MMKTWPKNQGLPASGKDMPRFLFVTFSDKLTGGFFASMARCGILKSRIGYFFLNIFYKRWLYGDIRIMEPVSGTAILLLKLPIPLSYLSFLNHIRLERIILGICRENECIGYFVPAKAKKDGRFETSIDICVIRSVAYMSLLLQLLQEIYAGTGDRLDNIDIVFVHEGENVLLQSLIRQIEPYVKFVRVAAKNGKAIEAQLSGICEESGLTIQIDSDYKRVLRGAGLVICTGCVNGMRGCRVDSNTVVIDYSNGGLLGLRGDFTYIKGIVYTFPKAAYLRLGEDVTKSFVMSELTDIIMILKTGLISDGQFNDVVMRKISTVFSTEGCRIKGFIGRREMIAANIIRKCVYR